MAEPDKSRRLTNVLLALLTVAALVIAGVLVYRTFVADDGSGGGADQERRKARIYFEDQLDLYCTFEGATYPGETIPECEERRVKAKLNAWEKAGRPDPSTIELP